MTVRALLLAGAILASLPAEAAAGCHHFSIWHNPWPQTCGHKQVYAGEKHVYPPARPDDEIPLPALKKGECDTRPLDDVAAARLQLLGYARAHAE